MLYKPTSPSPYAQCIALDRQKITNVNILKGYYIDFDTSSIVSCKDTTKYSDGVIYVYPIKKDYAYRIQLITSSDNSDIKSGIAIGFNAEELTGTGNLSNVFCDDDSSFADFKNIDEDGYLYVDIGNWTSSYEISASILNRITVEVTEIPLDDRTQFSCSMIGGCEIETARLKISDGNTQYYFNTRNKIDYKKDYANMYIDATSSTTIYNGSSAGLIYAYPIKKEYTYYISCRNNTCFRLAYCSTIPNSGMNELALEEIKYDDSLSSYSFKNNIDDGYLYVNFSTISLHTNEFVEVVEIQPSVFKALKTTSDKSHTQIEFNMEDALYCAGYTITNPEYPIRSGLVDISLSNIIHADNDYIWQTRLYAKDSLINDAYRSDVWIGYGVVENLNSSEGNNYLYVSGQSYDDTTKNNAYRICFKVRPHVNICLPNTTGGVSSITKNSKDIDIQKLYQYYDDNARYYIKVNGRYCPIRDYRFYSPSLGEDASSTTWSDSTFYDCFDSYGNPLYGYVVIDYMYGEDDKEPIVKTGDQYEIYCNYIDSDEYYFNVVNKPTLTFTGNLDETISNAEDSPTEINYSNLNLSGVYNHTSGVNIEKYNVALYRNTSNNTDNRAWELIEQTKDIYDNDLTYSYDMLMSNNDYKIVINTQDSLGYKVETSLYLAVTYENFGDSMDISVNYYSKHDSIIVDWSNNNFKDCNYFDVYKKIGNSNKLHKVYTTANTKEAVVEDFAVGNLCDYTYFVYPVVSTGALTPINIYPNMLATYNFDAQDSQGLLYNYEGGCTQKFAVTPGNTYYITGCNIGEIDGNLFPFIVCVGKGYVYGHFCSDKFSSSGVLLSTSEGTNLNIEVTIPNGVEYIYINAIKDIEILVKLKTSILFEEGLQIQTPSQSSSIKFNYGATTILGLTQDKDDLNTYTINYNEMWRFEFNLENPGTTLHIDKTFTDTQHQFPKMTGGTRKYNTIPVKGLIGYFDCDKDNYSEDYDLLEDWDSFAASNSLKLLKDRRGRLIPCGIESSSMKYMDVAEAPATVSFSARQLSSMDNITILGRPLIYNPVKYKLLTDSNNAILTNSNEELLTSQES